MRAHSLKSDFAAKIRIIYEDENFVAVNKPAHCETLAEPPSSAGNSLTAALREKFGENLTPAHRLDRDTSGAQLFAKNPRALAELAEQFKRRQIEKFYAAICAGVPANPTGVIRRNLSEWNGGRRPVSVVKRGGLTASTAYRVLAENLAPDLPASLILFHPREGRTHQIRVHAAAFGRPIIGDDQYGDRAVNQKSKRWLRRQALHAWRLTLTFRTKAFTFTADFPDDLQSALNSLFPAWQTVLRENFPPEPTA